MADIYIDSNALTDGSGASADDPYNNLTVLQTWAADMSGDTAYIAGGSEFREWLTITGSASNYSVKAYGDGEKPIFKGSSLPTWTQEGEYWYFSITRNTRILLNSEPLESLSPTTNVKADLVLNQCWFDNVNNRMYIKVTDNPNTSGVEASTIIHAATFYRPLEIRDLQFRHGYDSAFEALLLEDNVKLVSLDTEWGGSPTGSGGRDCMLVRGIQNTPGTTDTAPYATNVKVQYCTTKGAENNGIEMWDLNGAVLSNNLSYGNWSNEYELWSNVNNCIIEKNKVFGVSDSGNDLRRSTHFARIFGYGSSYLATTGYNHGNTFRNNLMVGSTNSTQPVVVEGLNNNNVTYNNTIINYGPTPVSAYGTGLSIYYAGGAGDDPTGTEFKNNIVITTTPPVTYTGYWNRTDFFNGATATCVTDFDGNCWYNANGENTWRPSNTEGDVTSIGTWNALSFVGATKPDVNADPELTADYKIESGSVAEGIGVVGLVTDDIDGNPRYGTVDAGCYQIIDVPHSKSRVGND